MDTPGAEEAAEPHDQAAVHPTMKRAEELVGKAGEYVKQWTVGGNVQVRRTFSRLKEDMEDMWVEAREIEHHQHGQAGEKAPSEETH